MCYFIAKIVTGMQIVYIAWNVSTPVWRIFDRGTLCINTAAPPHRNNHAANLN